LGKERNPVKTPRHDPWMLVGHVLEHGNKIHALELSLSHASEGISQLVNAVNKANYELSNQVKTLENRIAELERLQVSKDESKKESGTSNDEDPDFNIRH
jgi:hypothetical protein